MSGETIISSSKSKTFENLNNKNKFEAEKNMVMLIYE